MPLLTRSRSPNHIFDGLSARARMRICGHAAEVEVRYGQVLYLPQRAIDFVYFPLDCVISLLTSVDSGRVTEVGMVGSEGMLGVPLLLGITKSPVQAVVQGNGSAFRMTPGRLLRMVDEEKNFRVALFRYTHALMAQYAQTAACNRFHLVNARLARWLLMTSDRLKATTFYQTQEYLSHMLGVRRESVSEAARLMEKAGLIQFSRGKIHIRDRMLLKKMACSCYSKPGSDGS